MLTLYYRKAMPHHQDVTYSNDVQNNDPGRQKQEEISDIGSDWISFSHILDR